MANNRANPARSHGIGSQQPYGVMTAPVGHYSSFILRLWVEQGEGWHSGLIQHVATRNKKRFSSIEELLEFIVQHSGEEEFTIPFLLNNDSPDGEAPVLDANINGPAREDPSC